MSQKAFQDFYPEIYSHCFGCGRNNENGLQIKSYWEDNESICKWTPKKYYTAGMGILCGGILSTVLDCHCVGTAIAAVCKSENREISSKPFIPYAGGTLKMKFIKPTLIKNPIEFRAKITEIKGRKTSLTCSVYSNGIEC
ncbi:MAG: PaaI family thioesterase, partial [Promethearchaeota archaeon]